MCLYSLRAFLSCKWHTLSFLCFIDVAVFPCSGHDIERKEVGVPGEQPRRGGDPTTHCALAPQRLEQPSQHTTDDNVRHVLLELRAVPIDRLRDRYTPMNALIGGRVATRLCPYLSSHSPLSQTPILMFHLCLPSVFLDTAKPPQV